MPRIRETDKLARDTAFTAARQPFGAGFRRDSAARPPPPSISDNRISGIVPVILLAALSVLAVSAIYEAPPASAYHGPVTEVWSATLTTSASGGAPGCRNDLVGHECSTSSRLSDDDFRYAGVDYAVVRVTSVPVSGTFVFTLSAELPASIRSTATLHAGNEEFALADTTVTTDGIRYTWSSPGLSWSVGDTVQLSLTAQTPLACETLPAGYSIVLEGTGDVADGTHCSNRDDYYLRVSLRDQNGAPVNPTKDVCVLVERLSGDKIIANEIGLPRENYIRANTPSVTFRMNADTDLQARTLDGKPVTIVARTGGLSDTFDITVVHDTGAESCPAPSTTRNTPTTPSTPGTGGSGGGGGTSTPTAPSSGGGAFFFVPFIGDTTSPTIISMNTTGNATRTLGDGAPLLFNITFSETVTGVDPADFVLVSGNDTFPVSANATRIIATTNPNQVIPYNDTTEFAIDVESTTTYEGATISGGTVRFDIDHLGSHLLEVRLTAPDCRTILVHNQTFQFRPDLAKPRTIEPLAGSPLAGPWTLTIRDHALYQNATVHQFGLSLDVGPAIVINGTGSNYLVAVNAATTGNLTLGLADGHDIADTSGNRLAGGIPAGTNGTYVLAEPPRRTCP